MEERMLAIRRCNGRERGAHSYLRRGTGRTSLIPVMRSSAPCVVPGPAG